MCRCVEDREGLVTACQAAEKLHACAIFRDYMQFSGGYAAADFARSARVIRLLSREGFLVTNPDHDLHFLNSSYAHDSVTVNLPPAIFLKLTVLNTI